MKKIFSLILSLMSLALILSACGGGGGGGDDGGGGGDTTKPVVTAFTMPATATSLTVQVTSFTATDDTGVAGYLITSSATAPAANAAGWTAGKPTSYIFPAAGLQTAYAWAKDAAGNVSSARSAQVTITQSTTAAKPVQGTVTDPATGNPVAGATVSAFLQLTDVVRKSLGATPVFTAVTDSSGNYTIENLNANNTYYFEITKSGYAPFTYYNIIPDAGSNLNLERCQIIPSSMVGQTDTASGKVVNASTNAGLPGMTVRIRAGLNHKAGTVYATRTTDGSGAYSFASLPAGSYTAEITGNIGSTAIITSYYTLVCIPGNAVANSNQNFPVTTPLSSTGTGQYRIVLNWGSNPSDLDSYLTGPTSTGSRFQTSYTYDDYPTGSTTIGTGGFRVAGTTTEAFLDIDNTSHGTDNGPETTTIVKPRAGVYNFFVRHFSGSSNISASGAQVKVYKGSALLATFNPPSTAAGDDDVWAVFTMTVTTNGETITPINRIFTNFDDTSTSGLDGLVGGGGGGGCPSGPFTNKLTIGTGFSGSSVTGAGTSFSLSSLANGGDLYARIESSTQFEPERFARLYINSGTYGQKDYCSTCNTPPVLNCPNVMIGKFRITDVGNWSISTYSVPMAGFSESYIAGTSISIGQ